MGVTIHFEGQLNSDNDFNIVMAKTKTFAVTNNMPYEIFSEQYKKLERVKEDENWDYEGFTKGIRVQPDENSDPLWMEFDNYNYIQEYCKTQFAGINIHIKIILLLKEIEPYFKELIVTDEGEYWETENENILLNHFENFYEAVEEAKSNNPKLNGPYRLENGRFIDLMETDKNYR